MRVWAVSGKDDGGEMRVWVMCLTVAWEADVMEGGEGSAEGSLVVGG